MKLKLLFLFIIFSLNLLSAQNYQKIISVDLQKYNDGKLENLDLRVLHEFENTLITIVNSDQIEMLNETQVNYEILDDYAAADKINLVGNKNKNKTLSVVDNSSVIFRTKSTLLTKNFNPTSDETKNYDIVTIKEKPFKYSGKAASPYFSAQNQVDSVITSLIDDIEADSINYFIQTMQDFQTRYYLSDNRREVAEWIVGEFKRFGFTEAKLDSFQLQGTWQYNAIATLTGKISPDQIIVIGGHHDSITGENPMLIAPGADDNASGTTAVLEIARVLMANNYTPDVTIQFVTFAAEEVGLHGANYHARTLAANKANVRLMINHDMISNSPNNVNSDKMHVNYYTTGEYFSDIALEASRKFTPLTVYKGGKNSSSSDSYSYYQEGFPAIYFEEHNFSPFYHTNSDLISNINVDFCTEVIKASCATLISSMLNPMPVQITSIRDTDEGTAIIIKWTESTDGDFDQYIVRIGKSVNNHDLEFSLITNELKISDLEPGQKYYISVTVVDKDGNTSAKATEEFTPFNITLDRGLLVIDDTYDGNGDADNPTDEEVDEFYKNILTSFEYDTIDLNKTGKISVADIGSYSTILWHHELLKPSENFLNLQDDIKRYLEAGGNFIFSGQTPTNILGNNTSHPEDFEAGDFIFDYLKIANTEQKFGTRFNGGIAEKSDWPDLMLDSAKFTASQNYHLRNIESISATTQANKIYSYSSGYEAGTSKAGMIGMPVGIKYLGDDYKLCILSFPLYYSDQNSAEEFLKYILEQQFDETTDIASKDEALPTDFNLSQNYPNPFNPETVISYQLPVNCKVVLKIYDLLGREVTELVNAEQQSGIYNVNFDASKLSSGLYIYRLNAGSFITSKKMLYIK